MWLPSTTDFSEKYKELPWGMWATIMLFLSFLSGIIVGLHYDYTTPWYSTTAIELLTPYGHFFRSLHFYSSQLFFFFSIFHFVAVYKKSDRYSWGKWIYLTASLPVILLLLFTGYILRGDTTGSSAGRIAENLLLTIPLCGEEINNILFALGESGMRKVYLHHIVSFDLLLLFLLWRHLHQYRVQFFRHPSLIAAICAFCMVITAPLEPELAGTHYILGPWFFWGLQELLRYLPPIIAGVAAPLSFITALFLFHPGKKRIAVTGFFWGWLISYGIFSIMAFCREFLN